jgi:hypothetical protein
VQGWYSNLPQYGQTYLAEGYRFGIVGMSRLLGEWLEIYGRVPEKGLEFIRVMAQLGAYSNSLETDYFVMMILYPPPGGWEASVIMETYDALVEELKQKEAPVGKLVR